MSGGHRAQLPLGDKTTYHLFGAPIDVPAVEGETRLSHHKRFADAIAERIKELGAEERAIRTGASPPASPA